MVETAPAKAPITLTFDGLVQNAVTEELKKRATKTVVSEAMKTAGLGDVQVLLRTFGITPTVIEKGITMLFSYLEARAIASGNYTPPGGVPPGYQPPPPGYVPEAHRAPPPPPPPPPAATRIDLSPEAIFNRHLELLKNMVNIYGDIPISEALKKFADQKADIVAGLAAGAKAAA